VVDFSLLVAVFIFIFIFVFALEELLVVVLKVVGRMLWKWTYLESVS